MTRRSWTRPCRHEGAWVIVGERVKDFLESLAPEPRRKLWRAIKPLPEGKGDIKQLEGRLVPYWRLRVDRMRVICDQRGARRTPIGLLFCRPSGHGLFRPGAVVGLGLNRRTERDSWGAPRLTEDLG